MWGNEPSEIGIGRVLAGDVAVAIDSVPRVLRGCFERERDRDVMLARCRVVGGGPLLAGGGGPADAGGLVAA